MRPRSRPPAARRSYRAGKRRSRRADTVPIQRAKHAADSAPRRLRAECLILSSLQAPPSSWKEKLTGSARPRKRPRSQNPHLPAAMRAGRLSHEKNGRGKSRTLPAPHVQRARARGPSLAQDDTERSSNRDPTSTQGKLRPASFLNTKVQGLPLPKEV